VQFWRNIANEIVAPGEADPVSRTRASTVSDNRS
jgi:hypothetical protein